MISLLLMRFYISGYSAIRNTTLLDKVILKVRDFSAIIHTIEVMVFIVNISITIIAIPSIAAL